MVLKVGGIPASQGTGPLPEPDPGGPEVKDLPESGTTSSGQTKSIDFTVESGSGLSKLFAKVAGSSGLYTVDVEDNDMKAGAKRTGRAVEIVLEIPQRLGEGEFCLDIAVEDGEELASEPASICLTNSPSDNSPAAVLDRLQGIWERCEGGVSVQVTFEGQTNTVVQREHADEACEEPPQNPQPVFIEFFIGSPVNTGDGIVANEFDLTELDAEGEPLGPTCLDLIFVQPQDFFARGLAEDGCPEVRPTQLDFDNRFFWVSD